MEIYQRDYCKRPTEIEINEYKQVLEEETEGMTICRKNLYYKYPEAVRHHNSLFPNNHIELFDWKRSEKMNELTDEFSQIVHNQNSKEIDILAFINHKPAHYIIGSLLTYKNFGHHETYIFPEFSIGDGKYYADYLIIGKNSGGYEFVFVELEAPNKSTTIKGGYEGLATRSGLNQIFDWKYQIESDFISITNKLEEFSNKEKVLPSEFHNYDSTRMHYMVVVGLREDYNEVAYRDRRLKAKEQGIDIYHYDNLIDFSRELEHKATF